MLRSVIALLLLVTGTAASPALHAETAALVVIDMQPDFAERNKWQNRPGNPEKLDQLLHRQAQLIEMAKQQGLPILIVEYCGHGRTCELLSKAVGNYANRVKVIKQTDGLFDNEIIADQLRTFLNDRHVTELIMTGANGGACVHCSIEGALRNGYNVWTDKAAIADFNYKDFVYPYHYEKGSVRMTDPDGVRRLNQRENLTNMDEILNIARNSPESENALAARRSRYFGCLKEGLRNLSVGH